MLFESSLTPVTDGGSCVDDIRRREALAWLNAAVTHSTDGQSALLHFLRSGVPVTALFALWRAAAGVARMAVLAGILCPRVEANFSLFSRV